MAVHYVDVNQIGAPAFRGGDVAAERGKVSRQD
jgi:hypothetical protein